jgi:hypothetical protein
VVGRLRDGPDSRLLRNNRRLNYTGVEQTMNRRTALQALGASLTLPMLPGCPSSQSAPALVRSDPGALWARWHYRPFLTYVTGSLANPVPLPTVHTLHGPWECCDISRETGAPGPWYASPHDYLWTPDDVNLLLIGADAIVMGTGKYAPRPCFMEA